MSFPSKGEKKVIARKSTLILISMITVSLLGYLGLFFIYRYGLDYEYGVVAFAMAYVGLFSYMTNLGLSRAHIKHVSEGKDLGTCIGTYIVIKISLICIMVAVLLGSILFWKYILGRGFESSQHEIVIYLMVVFYVMLELANIANHTFSARRETAKERISTIFDPVIRIPIIIMVAIFSLGVFALAGAYILGMAAFVIVSMVLFRGYPIKKFDKSLFRSYYIFALPLIVSGALGTVMRNIDKVMIQLFWESESVGYYFGVERIISVLLLVPTAVTTLLFPTMSEYHGKNNLGEIRKLSRVSFRYVSMIVVPCAVLLILLSKPILYLFSWSLALNATILLQIMALYAFFTTFSRLSFNEIMAVGRPGVVAKIGIIASLTNIFLNILLIPKDIKTFGIKLLGLGAVGAAWATLISAIITFVLLSIASYKITRIKPPRNILLHILGSGIMGLALYGLTIIIPIERWYEVLGVCLLGVGIYIAVLYLLREFTKTDLNMFLQALSPKGMKDYVKSELKRSK